MRPIPLSAIAGVTLVFAGRLFAQNPAVPSAADFEKSARKLREAALLSIEPLVTVPTVPSAPRVSSKYPWKTGIVTTVFWIGSAGKGEAGSGASAWDPKWETSYGGFDNPKPEKRQHFIPAAFIPRLNPFYIALPYNDVAKDQTKAEARVVIPWFKEVFVEEGKSVCRDRWLAIRNAGGKVCYAQWSDCGPYGSDHWQYVFGNEKPKPNANGGAGLNVSPAVREYLGLITTDVTDWKFVEAQDVPNGPWALYGTNNPLLHPGPRRFDQEAKATPSPPSPSPR
ncbi:MAG: hypothetical protein ABJF10_20970 [Chthoniobacter sp.]|uniref:hypothetical protein n=1 Tax=Chthoniobacter sp. TaxID=2510640 RepID=UPI0032AC2961